MEKSLWTKSKNLKRNTSKKAKSSYKRTVSTKTSKPMKMSTGSAWCATRLGRRITNWRIYPPSEGKALFARSFMATKTRRVSPSPPASIQSTPTATSQWRSRAYSFDALSAKSKATASCPSNTVGKTKRRTRSARTSSTPTCWFGTRATTTRRTSWCCSSTCWNRRGWTQ